MGMLPPLLSLLLMVIVVVVVVVAQTVSRFWIGIVMTFFISWWRTLYIRVEDNEE